MKCIQLIAGNGGKKSINIPLNLKLTEMLNKYINLNNKKIIFLLLNKYGWVILFPGTHCTTGKH